ncbi:MAG: hypothetical protein GC178_03435 [Flavobacteriales bacterium]|nr:hypothetical protein [Flavobacteriales bacterium]
MNTPIAILQDDRLQTRLNEDGYIVVDLLNEGELSQLRELFHFQNSGRDDIPLDVLYTCEHNPDRGYRVEMNNRIKEIIDPTLARVFKDVRSTVYTFQIKGIGPNSELMVHQDWNFARADEGFRTYTFWVPLVNSTESNGTLSVLPGSHIRFDCIRGAGIVTPIMGHEKEILPNLLPLTVHAGQLVLFDSALVHASASNLSRDIRVSVMTNIFASKAETYLYFPNKERGKVDEYRVPIDFFLRYSNYRNEFYQPPVFGVLVRTTANPMSEFSSIIAATTFTTPNTGSKVIRVFKKLINEIL